MESSEKRNVQCDGSSSSTECSCDGGWDTKISSCPQSFERTFRDVPNSVPSLEDGVVEIVHKPPKKQHLANNDFANAINSFNNGQEKFLSAITSFVQNKAEADCEAAEDLERAAKV